MTALWLFPNPGQRTLRFGLGVAWIHKVGDIQATYTHSEQRTYSCSGRRQTGECQKERERDSICTWVGQKQTGASCNCERLGFLERWYVWKIGQWLSTAVGVPRKTLKGDLKHAGQGPCVQLPCQQREKIESVVCTHWVQLVREIRKVHSKGISWPQPSAVSRLEAVQGGEFGTVSATRTVIWELDGQELSTRKKWRI